MKLLWISLGGAAGTAARYLIGACAAAHGGTVFPWGTLLVNVVGSLLLGALMRVGEKTAWLSPAPFLALTVGVMGGFTTYSTFNFEVFALLQRGEWRRAAAYIAATLFGGLAAGALGWAGARAVVG